MGSICSHCGNPIGDGYKFCNRCGQMVEAGAAVAELVETRQYSVYSGIRGRAIHALTGANAGDYVRVYPSLVIGRNCDGYQLNDPTVSPVHARLVCKDEHLFVEDLGSLNGIYRRVNSKVIVNDQDIVQAGNTIFLFELLKFESCVDDTGTEFYGTPCRGERFRLVELLQNGVRGRALAASDTGIDVGRSEGNFTFQNDDLMSPSHFSIRGTQRGVILSDHASLNGTFVRSSQPVELNVKDQFFIGKSLFEVV